MVLLDAIGGPVIIFLPALFIVAVAILAVVVLTLIIIAIGQRITGAKQEEDKKNEHE